MKIQYEKGDHVQRLTWIESCRLEVLEVQEDGLLVKALERRPSSSYPTEPFFVEKAIVRPCNDTISNAEWKV